MIILGAVLLVLVILVALLLRFTPLRFVCLHFEPRDIWIGVYWDVVYEGSRSRNLYIYMCIIPMLPILLAWPLYVQQVGGECG